MVIAETPSSNASKSTESIVQASATGASTSGLPRAITPETTTTPGFDYQVITVGFKSALNYPFVVENSISSAQIFQYLPRVLKYPFNGDKSLQDVSVRRLIPYTASNIDYTITVAEVYFPKDSVKALGSFITTPGSAIYRNPDSVLQALASLIDSRIPLTGLVTDDQQVSGSSSDSNPSTNSYGSMDIVSNTKVADKGRIAGITIGAAAGCGLYMTLMVLLFRKFRKSNKALELPITDSESNLGFSDEDSSMLESSSGFSAIFSRINHGGVLTGDPNGGGDDMMMMNNNNNNLRPNNISEPVQASNSLGWYH